MDQLINLFANSGGVSEGVLITTMTVMMLLAGVCSVVFNKLKMPPIIGYLLAGILILNIFDLKSKTDLFSMDVVQVLKSFGLVMLMFGIGTELSLDKLKKTGKFAILVAVIQLPLMVLSGYVFGMLLFGLNSVQAIALGAIISGSSTAVVVAVLGAQERVSKEDVETLILVTVMEDIGQVIILSMVTPLFAGGNMDAIELVKLIILIIIFMVASIIIGVKVVPKVLDWVGDRTCSEVLLILSIGLCFTMAWLSTLVELSMAIGAFLMGVMVSQSKYSHEIAEKTDPMKQVFMAVFFISVGMDVDIIHNTDQLAVIIPMAIGICLLFMISKAVTVYLGYFIGGKGPAISFVSALSLMAMGEFAFIIAEEALAKNAVTQTFYISVVLAALISMICLPLITKNMFKVVDRFETNCPRPVAAVGKFAYGTRDEINAKIESSPSMDEFMKKNLKKTYFCILLIIIIEIVFSSLAQPIGEFLVKLINEFIIIDNINYYVYIGMMVFNFLLLVPPTYSLIKSIKKIDHILAEGEEKLVGKTEEETQKARKIYRNILNYSTALLVMIIDFVIMSVVPGPFGLGDKSSLIVIPIAVLLFILGVVLVRRKARKEEEAAVAQEQASADQPTDEPAEAAEDKVAEVESPLTPDGSKKK